MDNLAGVSRSTGFHAVGGALCLSILFVVSSRTTAQVAEGVEPTFQSIRSLIDAGRYVDAEAEAEGLVSTLEKTAGNASLEVARATDLLVEALTRNGKGTEARTLTLAEQVIRVKEAQLGPNDVTLASSWRNLADVLVEAGDYKPAIARYRQGLAIRQQALGGEHAEVAEDLDHLARALWLISDYDQALTTCDQALAIKVKRLDQADIRIARTLEIRGMVLRVRGDYAGAREATERALALREAGNPAHPEMAAALSIRAVQLTAEGDLVRAQEFAERAVALAERTLRKDHPDLASYLRILATRVDQLGDSARALALRERALALAEKSLGVDHPLVAFQLNDLALSFFTQGEYTRARALYERALAVYERRFGPSYSEVPTTVFNLGLLDASLGDFAQARREFNRAIATWGRVLGRDHPFVARATQELAAMLSDQGLYAEARPLYERALAIRQRKLGQEHSDVAETLSYLSTTLAKLGDVRRAHELSARALNIWARSAPVSWGAADALMAHGTIQAGEGDYAAARGSYEHALAIRREVFGSSHPSVAEVQLSLATALGKTGQMADGLGNALEAERIGRDHLRLTLRYLSERQALAYAAKRPKGLDLALSLAGSQPAATSLTVDALIRGRALTLDEMAARRHVAADASARDVATLWSALTSARQRLANLVVKGPHEQRSEQYRALIEDARHEKETAERALAEKSASFRAEVSRGEIGLNEVRAAVPAGSALVSFLRYDRTILDSPSGGSPARSASATAVSRTRIIPSYIAFALRAGESDPIAIPLGPAHAVDALVARWRKELTGVAVSLDSPQVAERSLRAAGAMLRQRVWDPIAGHLHDVKRIFVVPDGALNLVPLAALPVSPRGYLLEHGPVIHYLSTERDLFAATEPSSAGRGLLAVGGPSFEEGSLFQAVAKTSRSSRPAADQDPRVPSPGKIAAQPSPLAALQTPSRSVRSSCGSFQSLRFAPLPGSQREANDVAGLWRKFGAGTARDGESSQVLVGRDANEKTFKQLAPGTRVLHLATHGFFLGEVCASALDGTRSVGALAGVEPVAKKPESRVANGENPLLLSGLALAGANRRALARPDEEDGVLTAEEVASLNLEGVEWAVLSSCDTGLGELKSGEGVFGLRRAFQVAGARTVIMSLWPVEDQATSQWMHELYLARLQKRLDTADALHEASLGVIRDRRSKGQSTHPFFWAAFVAAGDWR